MQVETPERMLQSPLFSYPHKIRIANSEKLASQKVNIDCKSLPSLGEIHPADSCAVFSGPVCAGTRSTCRFKSKRNLEVTV